MKLGIVFGCFIPLHVGHYKLIDQALSENAAVLLGICGHDGDRGEGYLSFPERQNLMRMKYGSDRNIAISVVDDNKIGLTGKFDREAWEIWSGEFFHNAGVDPNSDIEFTWYTGDPSYVDTISQVFPKHKFTLIERDDVSGTNIRNDIKDYASYIDPMFLRYLIEHNRI